ncbi:MAG TPA: hypothetical protein VNL16_13645, partial [Chloroflexota bacterium]|nr:hypothetical protein [Chloroflexota bacterium]
GVHHQIHQDLPHARPIDVDRRHRSDFRAQIEALVLEDGGELRLGLAGRRCSSSSRLTYSRRW